MINNQVAKFSRFITCLTLLDATLFASFVTPNVASLQPVPLSTVVIKFDSPIHLSQNNKKLAEYYYNRGSENLLHGSYQKAIEDFSRAIEINPKYFESFYQRGVAFYKLKKYRLAVEDFTKAIQLKGYDKITKSKDVPDNEQTQASDLYYNRALILFQLGDKQGALKDLNWIGGKGGIGEYGNLDADGYYLRGRIRSELGDKSGSENDYNLAASYYLTSINSLEDKFSNPQALPIIAKVIKFSPNNICAYYYRSTTQKYNGNIQEAIESFTQVINIIRNNADKFLVESDNSKFIFLSEIYEIRGDLYAEFELNNSRKALEDYNQVTLLEADLKRRGIVHGVGELYISCARYIGYSFSRTFPSEQDAQSHLANVYYKRGTIKSKADKAGAIQDLQRALSIFIQLSDKTNEQKVRTALNSL